VGGGKGRIKGAVVRHPMAPFKGWVYAGGSAERVTVRRRRGCLKVHLEDVLKCC
jgi:hypothetical protein